MPLFAYNWFKPDEYEDFIRTDVQFPLGYYTRIETDLKKDQNIDLTQT